MTSEWDIQRTSVEHWREKASFGGCGKHPMTVFDRSPAEGKQIISLASAKSNITLRMFNPHVGPSESLIQV